MGGLTPFIINIFVILFVSTVLMSEVMKTFLEIYYLINEIYQSNFKPNY